jgi:hypothetical protein
MLHVSYLLHCMTESDTTHSWSFNNGYIRYSSRIYSFAQLAWFSVPPVHCNGLSYQFFFKKTVFHPRSLTAQGIELPEPKPTLDRSAAPRPVVAVIVDAGKVGLAQTSCL